MAGKRNPFDAVRAMAASDACAGIVGVVSSARPIELERGVGGWHVEWLAVPLAFMTCAASVDAMLVCLESLSVDESAMRHNLGDVRLDDSQAAAASMVERILAAHGAFDEP
jgi:3-carboxy-cis,cis-muconate cycloisomerase